MVRATDAPRRLTQDEAAYMVGRKVLFRFPDGAVFDGFLQYGIDGFFMGVAHIHERDLRVGEWSPEAVKSAIKDRPARLELAV
jgi:hypothetical protein